MIIFVVHYLGISILKPERHAPITTHRHRPNSGSITGKLMEPKAWQIHVFGA